MRNAHTINTRVLRMKIEMNSLFFFRGTEDLYYIQSAKFFRNLENFV